MNKTVYVVTSNINNKLKIEGVFSTYEYADKFCDVENSNIEEFRREDEKLVVKAYKLDIRRVPDGQCYKKYWDYAVYIDKDTHKYGQVSFVQEGKELVHTTKEQDVEIYKNEYIYCRSYVSKQEAENIANEQWQMFEQKSFIQNSKK